MIGGRAISEIRGRLSVRYGVSGYRYGLSVREGVGYPCDMGLAISEI